MKRALSAPIPVANVQGATLLVVGNDQGRVSLVFSHGAEHIRAVLLPPARDQLVTALLDWRYVADELPDDDTRVMIAVDDDRTDEPDFGYHADGKWWYDDEPHLSPVEVRVYAWAHTPGLPPQKGARA